MMRTVPVEEAAGMVLCHDITRIIPGDNKGPALRKGHIILDEDIPMMLNLGKDHVYVWEMQEGMLHENDAAMRMATAAAGRGITLTVPSEGKVNLVAACDGLLRINTNTLFAVNWEKDLIFATLHANRRVCRGKIVAGTRIIPLVIEETRIQRVEDLCRKAFPMVEVLPLMSLDAAIITTGNEVYHGRIKDRFGPVVRQKLEELGCRVVGQTLVSDRVELIVRAIRGALKKGAQLILVTGGMSVDPDDVTPSGIKAAGGQVITYGVPVLPGAMFMLATIGKVPVLGLPGCVMYCRTSIFDLVLPRILAGEEVTRDDLVTLAHGGLCLQCAVCRYPDCSFGKGA